MAYDVGATTNYIRDAARRRGIDPDIAVKVARSEGLGNGIWQSGLSKGGRREPSYGPFQLLVGGEGTSYPAGMGNDFKSRTGLDPSDPSTVNKQIDFALDHAAQNGWGAWYGAAKVGVGKRDGIGGRGSSSPLQTAVADRSMAGGSPALAGGDAADRIEPQASPEGGSMAAPTVTIGLPPKPRTKALENMLAQAMANGSNSKNAWDVIGNLAQVWASNSQIKKAETGEQTALQKAMAAANLDPAFSMMAQLGGDRESLAGAIGGQQTYNAQTAQRTEARADRQSQQEYERGQDATENARADKTLELQTAKANQAPEAPSSVREYEYAKQQGFGGTYQEWEQANRKAGATVINTGQDEGEFQKKAAGKMVDRFGTIAETGTAAANVTQTIPAMRELLTQAPTGPIAGRLAERFPGFSTAGDAFQATVNQIAPTLRVPGSGAISDRDMDVLMSSFPRLRNSDGANNLILGAFEKKAQINLQRSEIATKALRGEIDPAEADRQISELDRTPLLDDAMRQQLTGQPAPQQRTEDGVPVGGQGGVVPGQEQRSSDAAPVRRARNPQTGQVLELRNGQWVPAQ